MIRTAGVFAGQGAQFVGMGKDIAEAYPECMSLFKKADEILGIPLSAKCFEGPVEDLTRTDYCQPAIFVTSTACRVALERKMPGGVGISAMAGLSLGEWSALHMAEVLSFEDTVRALEARGRFMQEACEARSGAMMSVIGLDPEKLAIICADSGIEISNINSADQVVVSGEKNLVEGAADAIKAAGARKVIMLNVAGAYHSSLMKPAAGKLAQFLEGMEFRSPVMPVLSNVTGLPHAGGGDAIKAAMVAQVTSPVKWSDCIDWFKTEGIGAVVEFGPGRVVSGLVKKAMPEANICNVQDMDSMVKAAECLEGCR